MRSEAPLFFVHGTDYGLLVDSLAFLQGNDLADRSILFLPPKLYQHNEVGLGAETRQFGSLDEIVAEVDACQPAMVLLASGYLLTSQLDITTEQLKRFLDALRDRDCPVVTSDPGLGLFSLGLPFSLPAMPARTLQERRVKAETERAIARKFDESYRLLERVTHAYPAPLADKLSWPGCQIAEYFNRGLLVTFDESGDQVLGYPWVRPVAEPYWLFILAGIDYWTQTGLQGESEFVGQIAARLRQTVAAGRRAILIGPDDCLAGLSRVPDLPPVDMISFCGYQKFIPLLLFAEYVFYWNVASSSSIHRLFNRLPIFYFDRGHVSHFLEPFFSRTVELLYNGHEPIILDAGTPLTSALLEPLALEYRRAASEILEQLAALPTPTQMVARLSA